MVVSRKPILSECFETETLRSFARLDFIQLGVCAMHDGLQQGRAEGRRIAIDGLLQRAVPYILAALITGLAAVARAALQPLLGDHYPLATFYAAVAVIGWFWGVKPAVLAAVLGYWVGDYVFLRAQPYEPNLPILELAVYAVICGALIALVYGVYERQRRLDQALIAHASAHQAQKNAARARDQAWQRLEVVTNTMSVGVAQCNRDLEYTWMNPAYARGIGVNPEQIEQIVGRTIEDVLGREGVERFRPYFLRVLDGETIDYEGEIGTGAEPSRWIH